MTRLLTRAVLAVGVLFLASSQASALPLLQLDIAGGVYDDSTQSINAPGPVFTLYAVLSPKPGTTASQLAALLADTYYISASVLPKTGPGDVNYGSFDFDGNTVNVSGDMVYGTPPSELLVETSDQGDLAPHGIFPSFYKEFEFQFDPNDKTIGYNAQDNPGGLDPDPAGTSYFAAFPVDVTGLFDSDQVIHFDLYSSVVVLCKKNPNCDPGDIDIDAFAPFSHDANSTAVPEPGTLLLVSAGAFGLLRSRLRRRRQAIV